MAINKSDNTKERIIAAATELIMQSGGNAHEITIRGVAEKANVGTGLVNHYFGTKEKLLEICVQRIISGVIAEFRPVQNAASVRERIAENAIRVMDFLMNNKEISRISITADLLSPAADDNTMKTSAGFALITGAELTAEEKLGIFMLTSLMQAFFLRRDTLAECFGIDFYDKAQRDRLIDKITERNVII